ncbi:MAG: tryptophanase [bacterium]|nr:tryptophanase [bacterium]
MEMDSIEVPKFKNKVAGVQKERIYLVSKKRRREELEKAHYNLFKLSSSKVILLDFQTASGTGALSAKQHYMSSCKADPSYTSSESWNRLRKAIRLFTGKERIFPVHQGRPAEDILSEVFIEKGDRVLSNGLFDTTFANLSHKGAVCIDMPAPLSERFFRGNIDTVKLEEALRDEKAKMVLMTLLNNTEGGQPVSLANLKRTAHITKKYKALLVVDACRIAQNAHFIWRDEVGGRTSISEIIRECFSLADVSYMSLKKDGLAHGGGFIVFDNNEVSAMLSEEFEKRIREVRKEIFRKEGNADGYGGMPCEIMEQGAQGLREVVTLKHLKKRMGDTEYFQEQLKKAGAKIKNDNPPGGDAVYIDAGALLPGIPYPAKTMEIALYEEGGIRSCGIDSIMFGEATRGEILRLAIPAGVYGKEHFDYAAYVFGKFMKRKNELKGFKITYDPGELRHFDGHFAPL